MSGRSARSVPLSVILPNTQVFDIPNRAGDSPLVPFVGRRHDAFGHATIGCQSVMNRRQFFVVTLALWETLRSARAASFAKSIYIQPLGDALPDEDVALVVLALRELYGMDVRLLPRVPLPQSAYFASRRRYRAERLLDFLGPRLPSDGERILGLTAVDISTTKGKVHDWGVLGLGSLDGAAGVLSSFRCHKKSRDAEHARQRLAKVAVHEMGHTLGLSHCTTSGCLMHDGEGSVLTTDTEYDICAHCRGLLSASGHPIPSHPKIPWPPV